MTDALVPADVAKRLTAALLKLQQRLESPASRRAYVGDWTRWTRWAEDNGVAVNTATAADIDRYVIEMANDGLAKASRQRALSVLRSVYAELTVAGICTNNPARDVRNIRVDKAPRTPWLDEEGLRRLVAACDVTTWQGRRDRMTLLLLVGLGWRRAEIARLQVADFAGDFSTVTGVLKRDKQVTVGVPRLLREELQAWLLAEGIAQGPVLPQSTGNPTPISGRVVYDAVKRIAERAAARPENAVYRERFRQIAPHGIRRSDATILVETGTPIGDVQGMLGHESVTTTERYQKAALAARRAPGQRVLERVLPTRAGTAEEEE